MMVGASCAAVTGLTPAETGTVLSRCWSEAAMETDDIKLTHAYF